LSVFPATIARATETPVPKDMTQSAQNEGENMADNNNDIAAAQEDAKAAREKLAAYEAKERARVESKLALLPEESRERVKKLGDKLELADWADFVDAEVSRANNDDAMPPMFTPGARRGRGDDGIRQLHPKSEEILDQLGVDTGAGRAASVVKEGNSGKFFVPPTSLVRILKSRITQPTRMNAENLEKVLKSGKYYR
jgi:hypothetical protein